MIRDKCVVINTYVNSGRFPTNGILVLRALCASL